MMEGGSELWSEREGGQQQAQVPNMTPEPKLS